MLGEGRAVNRMPHILVVDNSPEDVRSLLATLQAQPWRLSSEPQHTAPSLLLRGRLFIPVER
jgi:hypothetical protein